MSKVIMEVNHISKKYVMKNKHHWLNLVAHWKNRNGKEQNTINAVNDISFKVYDGEIFGFLGPNGAGKSTTINMLSSQLSITNGDVKIDNLSLKDDAKLVKAKIGIVAQHNNLDKRLTARENLIYHASYFGMDKKEANKKADYYLERLGLTQRQHDYVKSYSGGMVQRLKIARAMIHQPKILFLDEPTTGLDPAYRNTLWELMLDLNKKGTTIFLTTHYMEEPEKFCNRIAIINQGQLKAIGTIAELKKLVVAQNIIKLQAQLNDQLIDKLKNDLKFIEKVELNEKQLLIYYENHDHALTQITNWLMHEKINIENFELTKTNLDDIFMHLTMKGDHHANKNI